MWTKVQELFSHDSCWLVFTGWRNTMRDNRLNCVQQSLVVNSILALSEHYTAQSSSPGSGWLCPASSCLTTHDKSRDLPPSTSHLSHGNRRLDLRVVAMRCLSAHSLTPTSPLLVIPAVMRASQTTFDADSESDEDEQLCLELRCAAPDSTCPRCCRRWRV